MWSRVKDALPEYGRTSAIPAAWIESLYLTEEPKSYVGKFWKGTKIRAVYGTTFVPAVAIDLGLSFVAFSRYSVGVLTRSDDVQDKRLKELKKYGTIFSKNALALFASPIGLVDPQLVELHFNMEKPTKGIISGGNLYRAPNVQIEYPETPEDVMRLIKTAEEKNQKIMPIGAGRSQGKQYIPEGRNGEETVALNLSQLNSIVINPENKTVTVGGGVRWSDIQNEANKFGLALQVMQASNVFSVGGSVGTNIHGWNHRVGVVSNTLLSLDLVNAKGEKTTYFPTPKSLFHDVTGGLGLFGTVTSAKIQLTDNEWLRELGTEIAPSDYVGHFRKNVQGNEDIRMHLYRLSLDPDDLLGSGVAVDYVRVGKAKPTKTRDLKQERTYGTRADQVMVNIGRHVGCTRKKYWSHERDRLLANNSPPLTTNEIMQPPINAMFHSAASEAEWLQEYFLPEENLHIFLQELGRLLMQNDVALINASVRFVKQHKESSMCYARDGDRFAVVLCFNQSLQPSQIVKATKWLRAAQHMAVERGGTYYLPYQHVSNPEDFNRAYPGAREAMLRKLEVDPNEVFSSGLYQKYLAPLVKPTPPQPNYYRELTKTPEMKERFAGFLKVVLQRIEPKPLFDLLEDILTYKDSPDDIYEELCKRLPDIFPSTLSDLRHKWQSLASLKQDLTEQASVLLDGVKEINGLVEIGYPGRFVEGFKKNFKVTGTIAAVYEAPSLADYLQTGFRKPYDQFCSLNYNDPNLRTLADNSADVITCYIGLHHFPEDKVRFFLTEVRRVLRPGGHLLLVDHDVRNADQMAIAHGAHIFFNAVTGVPLKKEKEETRLFAPMKHWVKLLSEAGLGYTVSGPDIEIIRQGDPSRNRMVCFSKPALKLEAKKSPSVDDKADDRFIFMARWRNQSPTLTSTQAALFVNTDNGSPGNEPVKEEIKRSPSPRRTQI